jgi:hypothetical protein
LDNSGGGKQFTDLFGKIFPLAMAAILLSITLFESKIWFKK